MATLTLQDRDQLRSLLDRLHRAEPLARERLPWASKLIRADLDELLGTLVDVDRGFGPNLGRVSALLDERRFGYFKFLFPAEADPAESRMERVRRTVRARRERQLSQAA